MDTTSQISITSHSLRLLKTYHGTHVAGIVGAEVNNGVGIAGVSSDTLYIAKVHSDYTSDDLYDLDAIINALNEIATIPEIKVVNMSFGSSTPYPVSELIAINNCWDAGLWVLVASAGNDASNSAFYPADYTNVMKVSSLGLDANYDYAFASYSNYGNIDICAPGGSGAGQGPDYDFGSILSTVPEGLFVFLTTMFRHKHGGTARGWNCQHAFRHEPISHQSRSKRFHRGQPFAF